MTTMTDTATQQVAARNLFSNDFLADGTIVLRLYFGVTHVSVKGAKAGKIVRRRYRNDQLVKIEARP